jgi:hypothetical protein
MLVSWVRSDVDVNVEQERAALSFGELVTVTGAAPAAGRGLLPSRAVAGSGDLDDVPDAAEAADAFAGRLAGFAVARKSVERQARRCDLLSSRR